MCVCLLGPRRRYYVTPLVLGQFSVQLFFFSIIIYASTEKKPVVAVQNPPVLLYDCVSRVVGGPAVVAGGDKASKENQSTNKEARLWGWRERNVRGRGKQSYSRNDRLSFLSCMSSSFSVISCLGSFFI